MTWGATLRERWPTVSLREIRARVRGWPSALLTASIALVVGLVSMSVGGMLTLLPTQGAYTFEVFWGGGDWSTWWYYPRVLLVQPWGIVQLSWLPTAAMVLVAVGAGIGATVSLGVVVRWLRRSSAGPGGATAAGVAAGAGPGVASLATVGACCACSSCTSAAGLALVAAASGTTAGTVYQVSWFLPVFQLAIVYVSLLAQELALRRATSAVSVGRRSPVFYLGVGLRLALLVAGTTWSMAMFVEWGTVDPFTAPPAAWYHWIFEHQLLSLTAIAAALFPRELGAFLSSRRARLSSGLARAAWAISAFTWGIWVPPSLTDLGLGGFGNELFGVLGLPASWGSVPPEVGVGPALLFHWALQHLLLAAFALALALSPSLANRPLLATVEEADGSGRSVEEGTGAGTGMPGSWPARVPAGEVGPSTSGPASDAPGSRLIED